uniref:Uncharacterized protein n=1 Tax=Setaria digitata TaxID=48799 RepID=A0A915PKL5_9BILA
MDLQTLLLSASRIKMYSKRQLKMSQLMLELYIGYGAEQVSTDNHARVRRSPCFMPTAFPSRSSHPECLLIQVLSESTIANVLPHPSLCAFSNDATASPDSLVDLPLFQMVGSTTLFRHKLRNLPLET